jgi:hypothetical protein
MLQRPEVPLHDADRQAVVQREVFGTLREHGSVRALARQESELEGPGFWEIYG